MNLSPFVSPAEELSGEREERLRNAENLIQFGVPFLDDAMIGIGKNDLVVIAARSGAGKSELATHVALTNALKRKRVYFLALEAERREIPRRMLFKIMARKFYANRAFNQGERPNYHHWYMGRQEALFAPYYEAAAAELKSFDTLKVFYRGAEFGLTQLHSIFATIKGEADLLVLDHLHYVDFADDNENRAHKEAVKEIRDLALLHGIPVILVAHIRKADRRNPNPVPDLEDIHGSSDIFKIATKAVIIAPARDQAVQPGSKTHRFPTYMRTAKCRQDGSLQWFCAVTAFDLSRGEYEPRYALGNHNAKGEWITLEEAPFWAKGLV